MVATARASRSPALPLAVAGLAAGGAALVGMVAPHGQPFYPRCPLYSLTGVYCPVCGATRAVHELATGHLMSALHDNVLLVALVPVVAAVWVLWLLRSTGRPVPKLPPLSRRWVVVVGVVLVVYGVLRNVPVAPFTALAPLR